MIKFLDLKKQYSEIKTDINNAVFSVINDAAFIGGKYVKEFEKYFAEYLGAEYCIGVGNGTDALEIAIEALSLPKHSEIIVPANTFIASAEAVTRTGHKVVFCDCDPYNYTISLESLKNKLTENSKAIIAVHLYGHPCDMDEILKLIGDQDIKIVEDCAQAHGAVYKGKKVGTIGDIGTFSFYPGKNLGAYGDGGAVVTNNDEHAKACRMIANHGRTGKYDHEFEGRNSRLDALQASILSVKLKYLDEWNEKRKTIADKYIKELKNIKDIVLPKKEKWAECVYHLFVIRTARRDDLQLYLKDSGIETGIHYPTSLPKLKAYDYLCEYEENFAANRFDAELLSLPIGEHLEYTDVEYTINKIMEFFK